MPLPEVRVERQIVPPDLLACAPEPVSPGGTAHEGALLDYLASLVAAGRDCRGKLDAVARIVGP
jgi:hypothetical protein